MRVILGSYALAREFCLHLQANHIKENFIFVNDLEKDKDTHLKLDGMHYPIVRNWKDLENTGYEFTVAIGNPAIKRAMVEKAIAAGLKPAPTYVHPYALNQDSDNDLGYGGLVAPGCIITTSVKFENYVTINLNTTIGHDCKFGKYATCNPGCNISGYVNIGEGVEIGTGASIRDSISVANYVRIGMGAAVVKDIATPNTTVMGVPAR